MNWNYRIVCEKTDEGNHLTLCEIYYNGDVPRFYCTAELSGPDLQVLEADLQRMHRAFTMDVLLAEDMEPKKPIQGDET